MAVNQMFSNNLSDALQLIVSKTNSKFRNIQAAVDAATTMRTNGEKGRITIYIKAGIYNEIVEISTRLSDLTVVGDGKGKTIVTGSRSVKNGFTTMTCATFGVFGHNFIGKDLTIRNTYGAGSQAVALLTISDKSVFYRCSIEGFQDTLFSKDGRQLFRECDIYGTVDFIFGDAALVIQACNILLRRSPDGNTTNVITAQGRTNPNADTGTVIQSSNILATKELVPVQKNVKSYLGRPWKDYSLTVYIKNDISNVINDPLGWLSWGNNHDTLFYVEYENKGEGSNVKGRVKWRGYHSNPRAEEVDHFTVAKFLDGASWLPATGVPFDLGF